MISSLFKGIFNLIGSILKGIVLLVWIIIKVILFILFIVVLDHIICGLLGGAVMGLFKGGSGLFNMGLRSFALGLFAKKG